jgi:hypothetical protein
MERSEDEAEEEADDDDLGEDDREHFIKEDGSKDDSEDTADEEVIKQDEAPKNREIIKKEPASTVASTDATGMKTEITGAVILKNNPDGKHDEVNVLRERGNMSAREDRFDRDIVWHGEDDDEEKTVGKHLYEKPEGRDGMTDINPKSKYDEGVSVIKFFGGAASKNILDKNPGKNKGHRKPEMRAVMVDIIDAVMRNRY